MRVFLDELFINQYGTKRRGSTPKDIARVLGLMRHGSFVAPMGLFFTLRLQFLLSDKSPCGMLRPRQWWKYKRILLPSYILDELKRLYHSLSDNLYHHMWHRPIGLLIDRVPTIITQTDAAYSGLGGWSAEFFCVSPVEHLHNFEIDTTAFQDEFQQALKVKIDIRHRGEEGLFNERIHLFICLPESASMICIRCHAFHTIDIASCDGMQ